MSERRGAKRGPTNGTPAKGKPGLVWRRVRIQRDASGTAQGSTPLCQGCGLRLAVYFGGRHRRYACESCKRRER